MFICELGPKTPQKGVRALFARQGPKPFHAGARQNDVRGKRALTPLCLPVNYVNYFVTQGTTT